MYASMGKGEMEEVCSPTMCLPTALYSFYLGKLEKYTIPWAFPSLHSRAISST